MTTLKDLRFASLLRRALGEWPDSIEIDEYVVYPNGNTHVPALWPYPELVSDKYRGTPDAVIMLLLHDEISYALLDMSKYCVRIHLSDLRLETIKKEFEKSLKEKIVPEWWEIEDLELIKAYFIANPPATSSEA